MAMKGIFMEIMLYQEPSQEAAPGAPLVGQLTVGPHDADVHKSHKTIYG